jgi:ribose transport system substrate-binding protein
MRLVLSVVLGAVALLGAASGTARAEIAFGDTASRTIALSNSYAGNIWRRAMLESWAEAADEAKREGLVADAPALTTSENTAQAQAAQIAALVAAGAAAIVVDAAPGSGLAEAIADACAKGVVVVTFDSTVDEACAWQLAMDFTGLGRRQVEWIARHLTGPVRLLEVRGIAGTPVDPLIAEGVEAGLKATGGRVQRVGTVYGDWTQSVARREVARILPELGAIDAVVTQGGDGLGVIEAFVAAGRDLPVVILGNRRAELDWWAERRAQIPYETLSISIPPSVVQIAFWTAQQILAGASVPKRMTLPLLEVQAETLERARAQTPEGGLTRNRFSLAWTADWLTAQRERTTPPLVPDP